MNRYHLATKLTEGSSSSSASATKAAIQRSMKRNNNGLENLTPSKKTKSTLSDVFIECLYCHNPNNVTALTCVSCNYLLEQ